jgi:hypothetical protein
MRRKITLLFLLFVITAFAAQAQTCSGLTTLPLFNATFNDGSGTANYSDNLNCPFLIQPAGATSITLNFTAFNTEIGYDYVYVHDGPSSAAPLIGTYSGTSIPATITSTGGSLWILFTSDGSYNFAGWTATYTCMGGGGGLCSGTITNTTCTGTITDGSGVGNYIDNMDCKWVLNPTGTNQAKLHFTQFDTELNYDGIFVYDGTDDTGTLLMTWSGNTIPPDVTSSTGALFVNFVSDGVTTYGGFSATYSCVTPQCSGTANITACSGTLTDGSGNQNYQNNLNCGWKIQPAGANYITLHFNSFNTYNYDDYMEVFDGPNSSAASLGYFYGNSVPADIVSSGGSIFIQFITDGTSGAAGWSINYTCNNSAPGCSGQSSLVNCNGSFGDGSGTSDYLNNLNCSWLMHPAGATAISLHFNSFNTEASDFVTIYDGATTAAPSLGAYSGSFAPADIVSSGGNLLVTFTSNGTSVAPGFDCSYTCSTVGIAETEPLLNFNVYPNPNDGTFKLILEFNNPSMVNLSMKDALGRNVKSWQPQVIGSRHSQKMELNDLPKGVYTLVAETNGRSYHKSVAVIK